MTADFLQLTNKFGNKKDKNRGKLLKPKSIKIK